jgi:hypothetical protein
MAIEQDMKKETQKWLSKIKAERKKINPCSKKDLLKNIDAYISDSEHFLNKSMMHDNASCNSDLIRAFEAVIWAWAYMEIGKDLGIIKETDL